MRVLKLVKHNRGLQVMYLAVRASAQQIMLLLLVMFIGTLVFSTMIYFAEFNVEDNFMNIPIGFWWSVITMTTVGYGDEHPTSGLGYFIGSLCAIAGMLATAMPIPVIANSFHLYYTYSKIHHELVAQKRKAAAEAKTTSANGNCLKSPQSALRNSMTSLTNVNKENKWRSDWIRGKRIPKQTEI